MLDQNVYNQECLIPKSTSRSIPLFMANNFLLYTNCYQRNQGRRTTSSSWGERWGPATWHSHFSLRDHGRFWASLGAVPWASISRCSHSWVLLSLNDLARCIGGGVEGGCFHPVLYTEKCSHSFCPTRFCSRFLGWAKSRMPDDGQLESYVAYIDQTCLNGKLNCLNYPHAHAQQESSDRFCPSFIVVVVVVTSLQPGPTKLNLDIIYSK